MIEQRATDPELRSLIERLGERVRKDFQENPLSVLGMPPLKGYAPARQHQIANYCLFDEGMAGKHWVGGIDRSEDIIELNKYEEKVENFLKWCKVNLGIRTLFYPNGGWHVTPSEVFGKENVFHLSNDVYLQDLEDRIKTRADIQRLPYKDCVFDAIYLGSWDIGVKSLLSAFQEFSRVVKEDGFFIVEQKEQFKNIRRYSAKTLERVSFPQMTEDIGQGNFALYKNHYRQKKFRNFLHLHW